MSILQQKCSSCLRELLMSEFYKKRDKYETVCRECKVKQKRERRKRKRDHAKAVAETQALLEAGTSEPSTQADEIVASDDKLVESGDRSIFKEFKYPDGRILRLTKPEWDEIVRHFIWLDKQALLLQKSGRISKKNWAKVDPRKVHSN